MTDLLLKFVQDFKYSPNREDFKDFYMSHPDYPSLNAITDTLDYFDIENIAAKVQDNQLLQIPNKIISLITTDSGEAYVYIIKKDLDSVSYLDENNKLQKESTALFLKKWLPIILAVDENESPVKNTFSDYKIYNAFTIVSALLLMGISYWTSGLYTSIVYSLAGGIGFIISVLMLQEQLGIHNKVISKICGSESEESDCNSVLTSDGAKLFKDFTLSDACLIFFTSITILNLFGKHQAHYISIAVVSIPIIFYSLYYQNRILKKWCTLCLGVIALLSIISFTAGLNYESITRNNWILANLIFAITLTLVTTSWLYVKPLITGYFRYQKVDRTHKRFKRNTNTFNALLNATQSIATESLQRLNTINIGKSDSPIQLVLFLSPTCRHCYTAFEEAYQLYQKYPDKIQLSIAFNINLANKNNIHAIVVETIMSTYLNGGLEVCLTQLIDWHINNMSLENFTQKHKTSISLESKNAVDAQYNWCQQNTLNYSPIKIFNQKLFPDAYSISEIKYFIHDYETNIDNA